LAEWLKKGDSTREPDLDLVLHLVACHHGECRPFAPVVVDSAPVQISLAGHFSSGFGKIDFSEVPSNPTLHRLDSPLGDRFWKVVAQYGWQELCWLEAILRLADHRASEEEQNKEASS
jgi:CRISPR-associated endonuclease/helicase Cas3